MNELLLRLDAMLLEIKKINDNLKLIGISTEATSVAADQAANAVQAIAENLDAEPLEALEDMLDGII